MELHDQERIKGLVAAFIAAEQSSRAAGGPLCAALADPEDDVGARHNEQHTSRSAGALAAEASVRVGGTTSKEGEASENNHSITKLSTLCIGIACCAVGVLLTLWLLADVKAILPLTKDFWYGPGLSISGTRRDQLPVATSPAPYGDLVAMVRGVTEELARVDKAKEAVVLLAARMTAAEAVATVAAEMGAAMLVAAGAKDAKAAAVGGATTVAALEGSPPPLHGMDAFRSHPLRNLPIFSRQTPSFLLPYAAHDNVRVAQGVALEQCSQRKIYAMAGNLYASRGSGLGMYLNTWMCALDLASRTEQTFAVRDDLGWRWAEGIDECANSLRTSRHPDWQPGVECFFRPLSACADYVRMRPNASNIEYHDRCQPANSITYSRVVGHLMQPNDAFIRWLLDRYVEFWRAPTHASINRSTLISLHIRYGDKGIEAKLLPPSVYLATVLKLARRLKTKKENARQKPVVFVSSEDATALDLFTQAASKLRTEDYPDGLHVISYSYPRPHFSCGGHNISAMVHAEGRIALPSWSHAERSNWSMRADRFWNRGHCPDLISHAQSVIKNVSLGRGALLNLYLAAEAHTILCDPSSNWCRLLTALRLNTAHDGHAHVYHLDEHGGVHYVTRW